MHILSLFKFGNFLTSFKFGCVGLLIGAGGVGLFKTGGLFTAGGLFTTGRLFTTGGLFKIG